MIEVIYKEETQEKVENGGVLSLPKNIRQIGMIPENYRIYVEDYVYTFLTKLAALAKKEEHAGRIAILTGDLRWEEGVAYLFIRGALSAKEAEASFDQIAFTEHMWETIGTENKQYFPHQEIVGWFLVQQGLPLYATDLLTRTHVKYFGGEKILFLMEPSEQEEAFLRYDNGFLLKQPGYYLYYEKNVQMQNYMVAKKEELEMDEVEQTEDEAVKSFRKIIKNKKKKKRIPEKDSPFTQALSYAATACLVAAVAAAGFRFYRNYRQLQSVNQAQQTAASGVSELYTTFSEEMDGVSSAETSSEEKETADSRSTGNTVSGSSASENASTEKMTSENTFEKNTSSDNASSKNTSSENTSSSGSSSGKNTAQSTSTGNESAKTDLEETSASENVSSDVSTSNTTSSDKNLSIKSGSDKTAQTSGVPVSVKATATPTPSLTAELSGTTNIQKASETTSSADSLAVSQNAYVSYVVHPGDSLFQISLDHYGTIDRIADICALNGLSEEEIIYPGQIILLP